MKNGTKREETLIKSNSDVIVGKSIEEQLRCATVCNEPIEANSPSDLFTERADGVLPQYNIRTDTWEIAQDAMDRIARTAIARREAGLHTENKDYMQKVADAKQKMKDDIKAAMSVEPKAE